jgi:hypothetical protein
MEALNQTYGWEFQSHVLIGPYGDPVAGVPFCRVDDVLGARIAILPFSDYCDPMARKGEDWAAMVEMLLAQSTPISLRCLRCEFPREDSRFKESRRAKWHGLDIRPEIDALWQGFEGGTRRAVRTAEKEGVTIRAAVNEEDVRSFYELHLQVRKYKYRLLAQPFRFFESLWKHFLRDGRGFLLLASVDNRVIAGTMFLRWKETLYYKFNASLPEYLSKRPNDLIVWQAIIRAKQEGYTSLDFGLSDWEQEGLIRFKRKFGSTEKKISFLSRADGVGVDPKYQAIREIIGGLSARLVDPELPDRVTELGGTLLYQLFV